MSITETSICNSALIKVGGSRIISLTQSSVEARLCSELYEKVRDDPLRSHPWNFAVTTATLAVQVSDDFGFDKMAQLPGDCLRVLNMSGEQSFNWKIFGRKVYTDSNEIIIRYVKKVTDPS